MSENPTFYPARTHEEVMQVMRFLDESNKIENEFSIKALEDALDAWSGLYARVELKPTNLTLATILETHNGLLKNIEPDIAGRVRDCDVWIGGKLKMFVSVQLLEDQIKSWLKECDVEEAKKLSVQERADLVQKWHVAFEEIHPFADGNGRIGRMLWQLQRMMLDLPVEIIDHRLKYQDYYPWFQAAEPPKEPKPKKKRAPRAKLESPKKPKKIAKK